MSLRPLFEMPLAFDAHALWFSADGAALVARGEAGAVLCLVPSGVAVAQGEEVPLGPHAFSRASGKVALRGRSLRVVDLRAGTVWAEVDVRALGWIQDVALSPDASLAAVIVGGHCCHLIELPRGRHRHVAGGYVSRDRWSCSTEVHGARLDALGARLLTFGAVVESRWGVATHHGDPDEENDHEDFLTVFDAVTGAQVATEPIPRSRHVTRPLRADWIPGSELVLRHRDGEGFRVCGPDLVERAGEWWEDDVRELHATPDGQRVIAVGEDGRSTLWTLGAPEALIETREGEADPRNGFGLPTVPGEAPPRYRAVATSCTLHVEAWPERQIVARVQGSFHRVAVRPGSLGSCFATLSERRLTLWQVEG